MTEQSGSADRPGQPSSQQGQSGSQGETRQRRGQQGGDIVGDLQRWFIRQGAKSMRKEIGGQVRQTLGGRRDTADVWDIATTEIPPEAGESPECQWCPICRAARRLRESGPGLGDQVQGAGEVVAAAVQDAMSALEGFLGKAGGSSRERPGGWSGPPPPGWTGRQAGSDTAGQAGEAGTGQNGTGQAGTGTGAASEQADGQ